jgi:hypothetical protein
MDPMQRLRAWTRHRQRLGHDAADALEALRSVAGVYSAHPSAPLALLARSAGLTRAQFGDLERRRLAVRLPAMRGSVFLVPLEMAPRILAATRISSGRLATRLRALGLDERTYERLRPRVLEAAREPIAPADLRRIMGDGAGARRPSTSLDRRASPQNEPAVVALRMLAREGLVLRVGWDDHVRTDRMRWVATEAWLGRPFEDVDPDVALAWLAGRYLEAFGPARTEDFGWWTGVPLRRARSAVGTLATADVGDGLLLPEPLADAYASVEPIPPDAVDVLPKWDPYTMGHAPDGRRRLVDDEHLVLAYSTPSTKVGATTGDGLPLILVGGRAVATWSHRLERARMAVSVTPFAGARLPSRRALEAAFKPSASLMEATIAVEIAPG